MASSKTRQSWADAPRVFISLPACPKCGGNDLEHVRSYANGDGSYTRRTVCRKCGCRFFVVAEPIPEKGKEGELMARSMQWDEATGAPHAAAIDFHCCDDPDLNHGYHQDKWQPVRDKIAAWCGAIT